MKKLFLILFLFTAISNIFAQAEFKILIKDHIWTDVGKSGFADLQINIRIDNIGNETGICEEISKIKLYSSSNIYNYQITLKETGTYAKNKIKPNDYISSFLTFTVPKDAYDLRLKFDNDIEGEGKFISDSYNSYIKNQQEESGEKYKKEGDINFNNKDYEFAIKNYIKAYTYDPKKKESMERLIAKCYCTMGEDLIKKFKNEGYHYYQEQALNQYLKANSYDSYNFEIKDNIAKIYEEIGDEKLKQNNMMEAKTNFDLSIKYLYTPRVYDKINNIETNLNKIKEGIENTKNETITYDNISSSDELDFRYPSVGFEFNMGYGQTKFNKTNKYLPFLNAQINIPIKLNSPSLNKPLTYFLDFGAGSNIYMSDKENLKMFLNKIDLNNYDSPGLFEAFINFGFGLTYLSKNISPTLKVYYGFLSQRYNFEIDKNDPIYKQFINKINVGYGTTIEFSLTFSKSPGVKISYIYKKYTVPSQIDFIEGDYNSHIINLGIINF